MTYFFFSFTVSNDQLREIGKALYRKIDYCVVTFHDEPQKRYAVVDIGGNEKKADWVIEKIAPYTEDFKIMSEEEFRNLLPFGSDRQYSMSGSDECVALLDRFGL